MICNRPNSLIVNVLSRSRFALLLGVLPRIAAETVLGWQSGTV